MRILKKFLLVVVVIIALILIIALFVKKDYTIEREVVINEQKDSVFNFVKYLRNQNEFSKWARLDPAMKTSFSGTDATPGFISAWEGNKDVGKGEQEILKIQDGYRIDYQIRFKKPFESAAGSYIITEPVLGNRTKVRWSFSGNMPYPFNIMRLFNMEGMIGNDLQEGLNNLKTLREKI